MRGLPDNTRVLFDRVRVLPQIARFTLVGGTALALRIGHRLSEDLDFLAAGRLDRRAIEQMLESLYRQGCKITKVANLGKMLEFDAEGVDAADYAQRWKVDGVKLDFFTKTVLVDGARVDIAERVRAEPIPDLDCGHVRVASEHSLFGLKVQLIEERLTVRDLFDLRCLLSRGRSIRDLLEAADALGASPDAIKLKLMRGRQPPQDPPVHALADIPAEFEVLQAWFMEAINEYERGQAQAAARQQRQP